MSEPGDLHWEYMRAGLYETQFWCNGYRYKVEKDEFYNNEWRLYYIWYHSNKRPREWKRYGEIQKTKKEAQELARRHNMKPRTKYKFAYRVPFTGPLPDWRGKKGLFSYSHRNPDEGHYGQLKFVRPRPDGEFSKEGHGEYLDWDSIFVEFSELPPEHPARKELIDG